MSGWYGKIYDQTAASLIFRKTTCPSSRVLAPQIYIDEDVFQDESGRSGDSLFLDVVTVVLRCPFSPQVLKHDSRGVRFP